MIDENLKQKFLNIHNELRNNLAMGNNDKLSHEATDMATMVKQI